MGAPLQVLLPRELGCGEVGAHEVRRDERLAGLLLHHPRLQRITRGVHGVALGPRVDLAGLAMRVHGQNSRRMRRPKALTLSWPMTSLVLGSTIESTRP